VTNLVSLSIGPIQYNAATGHFLQTVTVRNTGANPIAGPFSLALDNLSVTSSGQPVSASVVNKSGVTQTIGKPGSAYVDFHSSTDDLLLPGATITVTIELDLGKVSLTGLAVTFKARVLAGTGQR
jgi:hypothetical protein